MGLIQSMITKVYSTINVYLKFSMLIFIHVLSQNYLVKMYNFYFYKESKDTCTCSAAQYIKNKYRKM